MPKVSRKESSLPLQEVVDASEAFKDNKNELKRYAPEGVVEQNGGEGKGDVTKKSVEFRRISVPQHRMAPLKEAWLSIYEPITKYMNLDMRMNLKTRKVEIKTKNSKGESMTDGNSDAVPSSSLSLGMMNSLDSSGALQRSADFVQAFILGFTIKDAIALLRMDDLYVEKFEIKDVKTLKGEHLARCIGRIAGKGGKTKFTVENATKTRIVLADTHIYILGSFANIKVARDAICSLILGSPPGKVYTKLRTVCARIAER